MANPNIRVNRRSTQVATSIGGNNASINFNSVSIRPNITGTIIARNRIRARSRRLVK
jgi:hypothetical protein